MKIFSENLTETLPSKNPKTLKKNPETWFVNEKVFDKYDILQIVEKFYSMMIFSKTLTETITI